MKAFLVTGVFVWAVSVAAVPAAERTFHLPDVPYQYAYLDLPSHFTEPGAQKFDNTPADNPVTDAGATLGRVLFYDTRLSANNTISCGSCHVQSHAFVDPNRFSKGFKGGLTDRHAMTLVNLRFHPRARFFWDERSGNLEAMVLLPVENRLEMGQELLKLSGIVASEPRYAELFGQAFGDAEITNERIARALAQFLRSMVSYQSRYDDGRLQVRSSHVDFPNFTIQENRGKALFLRNCALCHLPDQDAHFVMTEPVNTGLDEDTARTDGASVISRSSRRISGASSRRRCATSRSPRRTCTTGDLPPSRQFSSITATAARTTRTKTCVCSRCISPRRNSRRLSRS
jgi:cytochrome c peroxidase